MGPQLGNNLLNLGIEKQARKRWPRSVRNSTRSWPARKSPDWAMAVWAAWPPATWTRWPPWNDPVDRLRPFRYEFGIFDQEIQNGWQVEKNRTNWLVSGNPLGDRQAGRRYIVNWGGYTEQYE